MTATSSSDLPGVRTIKRSWQIGQCSPLQSVSIHTALHVTVILDTSRQEGIHILSFLPSALGLFLYLLLFVSLYLFLYFFLSSSVSVCLSISLSLPICLYVSVSLSLPDSVYLSACLCLFV